MATKPNQLKEDPSSVSPTPVLAEMHSPWRDYTREFILFGLAYGVLVFLALLVPSWRHYLKNILIHSCHGRLPLYCCVLGTGISIVNGCLQQTFLDFKIAGRRVMLFLAFVILTSLCLGGTSNYLQDEYRGARLVAKEDLTEAVNQIDKEKIDQGHGRSEIIQTAPVYGNLKERSLKLAKDITKDLYIHGWQQSTEKSKYLIGPLPKTSEQRYAWCQNRSMYFRYLFLRKVIAIQSEFAQLHIKDENLEAFLSDTATVGPTNNMLSGYMKSPIQPQAIEMVAESLKAMAGKIPTVKQENFLRSPARPLPGY